MDFVKTYFNKSLNDLLYEDIQEFFLEEKEESETIEFKSFVEGKTTFDDGLNNVIRGLSAFLNSDGGVLIWGTPKGVLHIEKNTKIFSGDLQPINFYKEKDSLINIICNRITLLPVGITVKIIESLKKYIYVFEIQPSFYKPHQFNDKYFVRLDGQSKPAPHYLIDALFKRVTYPNIEGFVRIENCYLSYQKFTLNIKTVIFNFSRFQNEENVTQDLVVSPGVFSLNGSSTFKVNAFDVVHFGMPRETNLQITVPVNDLKSKNSTVNLILAFGGKHSPAKVSIYNLKLDNKVNEIIESIEENILFSDHQDKVGTTRESILKNYLNR